MKTSQIRSLLYYKISINKTQVHIIYRDLIGASNFQRVLIIYVDHCDMADLNTLAERLMVNISPNTILNTRFLTYLTLKIIDIIYRALLMLICSGIKSKVESLFEANFFRFMLSKIIEGKVLPTTRKLEQALANIDDQSAKCLELH